MDARARHALLARLSLEMFAHAWALEPDTIRCARDDAAPGSKRDEIAAGARRVWLYALALNMPLYNHLETIVGMSRRALIRTRKAVDAWSKRDERIAAAVASACETVEALNAFLSTGLEAPRMLACEATRDRRAVSAAKRAASTKRDAVRAQDARLSKLAAEMRAKGHHGAADAIAARVGVIRAPARSRRAEDARDHTPARTM